MAYPLRERTARQPYAPSSSTSTPSTPFSNSGAPLSSVPYRAPGQATPTTYNYRPSYAPAPPSRPVQAYQPSPAYPIRSTPRTATAQTYGGTSYQPSQNVAPPRPEYHHPSSFPPGQLPFFVAPPGQRTFDPTLNTPPCSQAFHSTYASRMRTGVTGLIQPENVTGGPREREMLLAELDRELAAARSGSGASTPRPDSPAPLARAKTTMSGRRTGRGGAVNYAEKTSDEEESESELSEMEEPASDPEDTSYGERRRRDRSSIGVTAGSSSKPLNAGWANFGTPEGQAAMRAGRLKKKRDEMDRGFTWLGDRVPGERVTSRLSRLTRHTYVSEDLLDREAGRAEMLVPITVDLDISSNDPDKQGIKIKDRFLWNMNEPFITPRQFANIFCEDLAIPSIPYAETISDLIQGQLDEASGCVEIDLRDRDVTEEDVVWSEDEVDEQTMDHMDVDANDRPGLDNGTGHGSALVNGNAESQQAENGAGLEGGVPTPRTNGVMANAHEDQSAAEADAESMLEDDEEEEAEAVVEKSWEEPDCRIIVNLDVQIYTHILRDRIEWDLSSPLPPALFAKQYCSDLGLTGEAIPLVAHAITDELLKHKKDALELELFSDTHPEEQAKWEKGGAGGLRVNNRHGAKGLVAVWRDWSEREEFGPVLVELTMEEMEKRELERNREARRMMRTLGTKRRR